MAPTWAQSSDRNIAKLALLTSVLSFFILLTGCEKVETTSTNADGDKPPVSETTAPGADDFELLSIQPPVGTWVYSTPVHGMEELVIGNNGRSLLKMRDESGVLTTYDVITRPDSDGSLTLQFYVKGTKEVWGTLFFYSYAQEPNGDLVLENADGTFVGARI